MEFSTSTRSSAWRKIGLAAARFLSVSTYRPGVSKVRREGTNTLEARTRPRHEPESGQRHQSEVQYQNETGTRAAEILDSTGQTEVSRDGQQQWQLEPAQPHSSSPSLHSHTAKQSQRSATCARKSSHSPRQGPRVRSHKLGAGKNPVGSEMCVTAPAIQ